jgi:hypothetical protein
MKPTVATRNPATVNNWPAKGKSAQSPFRVSNTCSDPLTAQKSPIQVTTETRRDASRRLVNL